MPWWSDCFAALDYLQGTVQPLVAAMAGQAEGWGRIRLVLVHHRLRLVSGMDLVRKLVEVEACPVPILIVGTEEGQEVKRERARSLGALDFVPVQPFRILTLKLALEEALRLLEQPSPRRAGGYPDGIPANLPGGWRSASEIRCL